MIQVHQLTAIYHEGTPFEFIALQDVSTIFEAGKFYAVIGHTGSGKSTFIQHLNGLIVPTRGEVHVHDTVIHRKTKHKQLNETRKRVGIVFQFPEAQLFDETVLKDVMFGPLNLGMRIEDARENAEHYLRLLGIPEEKWESSPFELSGGQMRKVAIASILAMDQDIVIFDEPTAGLDPKSHREVMALIRSLNVEAKKTIILVTHNMEDCYSYADEVKLFNEGQLVAEGAVEDILTDQSLMEKYHLQVPKLVRLTEDLKKEGFEPKHAPKTVEEFIEAYRIWRSRHVE